ncbi:polyprenyl synthetase family protein [Alicyclobacillus fastidiosus]|uniref:Polyprenyl synthetase family protein n=1 Tax=Alicyclobacillus fastidiosus TaxID=392011 RepID=A0ABV5AFX2_9BACL|nr:farnesyl diphosphate synthase [Alicyclobacillus fastidiosus]WEH11723.1 polyprenyl synthetase family protein [Alicyclobacillus fastidiosus]
MSYLESCKSELNQYLETALVTSGLAKTLYDAMNYSLLNDGKRLRPALCMATAETFGVDRQAVLPAAAALEMIHSYSLIHDDLPCMDDDDLRRGQPTNHKVFGDAMALLAGDGLLTEAFVQLSKPLSGVSADRQVSMLQTLALRAGAAGMVGGQAVDVELTGHEGTLADVEFIHLHKTARLIQASIEIGALFPELPTECVQALSVYGESLGLAFQMIDDVLDVVGSQEELGKTPGKDVQANKLTYPRFLGIEATREQAAQVIARGEQALAQVGIASSQLKELQSVVLERTH